MTDYAVENAYQAWANYVDRVNGASGHLRHSSMARMAAEGPIAAAIRAAPGSRIPAGAIGLPAEYLLVERALSKFASKNYRLVLMARSGLLDVCAGCRSDRERMARLGISVNTWSSCMQRLGKAVREELDGRRGRRRAAAG